MDVVGESYETAIVEWIEDPVAQQVSYEDTSCVAPAFSAMTDEQIVETINALEDECRFQLEDKLPDVAGYTYAEDLTLISDARGYWDNAKPQSTTPTTQKGIRAPANWKAHVTPAKLKPAPKLVLSKTNPLEK
jgi:hypothetical protein